MKKIALVDLDSILFACFQGNKIPDGNGGWLRTEDGKRLLYTEKTPEEVIQACDDIFTMILTDCGADGYLAWIKGRDTIKDRLAVNPEYKQDRNQESPKYWKLCSDHFVNKWGAHLANGLETDDCLNICKLNVPNSFLCCIDSDLLGTEGIHWNWKKKEWVTSTKQTEEDNLYTDMIVGTHNNVKGLPKKGKKFAEKFLEETDSFCRANALTELYIQAFGPDWTKEFDKNYKCIKLLTSKEGFEIPAPTKFEPKVNLTFFNDMQDELFGVPESIERKEYEKGYKEEIEVVRYLGEPIAPITYTNIDPSEDILSENWFNTVGETDRTEEIPEF